MLYTFMKQNNIEVITIILDTQILRIFYLYTWPFNIQSTFTENRNLLVTNYIVVHLIFRKRSKPAEMSRKEYVNNLNLIKTSMRWIKKT
jgi:hypothetical protein